MSTILRYVTDISVLCNWSHKSTAGRLSQWIIFNCWLRSYQSKISMLLPLLKKILLKGWKRGRQCFCFWSWSPTNNIDFFVKEILYHTQLPQPSGLSFYGEWGASIRYWRLYFWLPPLVHTKNFEPPPPQLCWWGNFFGPPFPLAKKKKCNLTLKWAHLPLSLTPNQYDKLVNI